MNRIFDEHRGLDDAEEAEVQKQIASDPDDGEATDLDLAQARPFAEALPELIESIQRARSHPVVNGD